MAALTEQMSLRISEQQRDYLQRRAAALTASCPATVTEADVLRLLIDRALLDEPAADRQKAVAA